MNRSEVTQVLCRHGEQVKSQFAVRSLELFGSVARNEATDQSDVDLLVEFDRPVGYFHLFALQDYLEEVLGGVKVDLVLRSAVADELRDRIYQEAIHVL